MKPVSVSVIGGGSWGTTVGHLAAHNAKTLLWARAPETVVEINESNVNRRYLEGYDLHPDLTATADLEEAVRCADVLVMGDDWAGKFDHFGDICSVVYLPRTPSVSTTAIIERISDR